MITTIVRKEWREHRAHYVAYWLLLNAPILLIALLVATNQEARVPFRSLTDDNVLQHLPLALTQAYAVSTLYLFFTGSLAIPMFNRDAERGVAFLLHEQPVSRGRFLMTKLAVGVAFVLVSVVFSILFAVAFSWMMMLLSGKVTWAGSSAHFGVVFAAAFRCSLWCVLLSLFSFTSAALLAAISPRWWIALLTVIVFVASLLYFSPEFFDFSPEELSGESISVALNLHYGESKPWVMMSRALRVTEIQSFGLWKPLPLLVLAACTALFAWLLSLVYQRGDVEA